MPERIDKGLNINRHFSCLSSFRFQHSPETNTQQWGRTAAEMQNLPLTEHRPLTAGKLLAVGLCVCFGAAGAAAQQPEPAKQLVREVVYNELHDHEAHGNWHYWIKQHGADGTRVSEQVETHDGPVTRVLLVNGQPVNDDARRSELAKLEALITSPAQQQNRREAYAEDEKRVSRILSMLPDAFILEDAGQERDSRHLRFRPDPSYSAKSVEAKVFHAVSGDLWVDTRMKRLIKLQGRMEDDLSFGMGLLGRVDKGSWFRIERAEISPAEWKMTALEVHMHGRAVLFKTLAHDTSEVRGGFTPLPASLTLSQGVRLLAESNALNAEAMAAQFAPASLVKRR